MTGPGGVTDWYRDYTWKKCDIPFVAIVLTQCLATMFHNLSLESREDESSASPSTDVARHETSSLTKMNKEVIHLAFSIQEK